MGERDLTPKRGRGRPRDEAARAALLQAAIDLVGERGYRGFSMEDLAARAGTGKQTIYRWWAGKAEVVLEALAKQAERQIAITSTGDPIEDLRTFMKATFAAADPTTVALLKALASEAQVDDAFARTFRTRFIDRRRAALAECVARARAAGNLPAGGADEVVVDALFGAMWYRLLITGTPLDAVFADALIDAIGGP
ncbi:MAG TPA: TetR/AcrR family transcriptional regulator [Devosiaceae bacterium]|nr:TetR/AcrR family transcriptional regulator [Devosiaceae bacterium]